MPCIWVGIPLYSLLQSPIKKIGYSNDLFQVKGVSLARSRPDDVQRELLCGTRRASRTNAECG